MDAYARAIQRLAEYPWSSPFDLATLLSALRGPDSIDHEHKDKYTAPIRLYLLGAEAYTQAGYSPTVDRVTPELPSESCLLQSHYHEHIWSAIQIIKLRGLPPAEE